MKQRILLVEDEKDLNNAIRMNLEYEGYEVIAAYSGEEALAKIAKTNPDLVVLDIMMPNIDGWEVLSHIRSDPKTADIPVIILTAKTEEISILFGYNLGTDDYITKPFSMKQLVARISAVLKRYQPAPVRAREPKVELAKIPVVRGGKGVGLIDEEEIVYARGARNYTHLYTPRGEYVTRFTLSELGRKLSDAFFRIHRSYIVNLRYIEGVFSPSKLSYRVQLRDEQKSQLPVSRSKIKQVKSLLGV